MKILKTKQILIKRNMKFDFFYFFAILAFFMIFDIFDPKNKISKPKTSILLSHVAGPKSTLSLCDLQFSKFLIENNQKFSNLENIKIVELTTPRRPVKRSKWTDPVLYRWFGQLITDIFIIMKTLKMLARSIENIILENFSSIISKTWFLNPRKSR